MYNHWRPTLSQFGLWFRYENDLPPSSFSREQLAEIRKSSLARILCDNGDQTDFVQPLAMVASDIFLNAFQYCNTQIIPQLDLGKWKVKSEGSSGNIVVNNNLIKSALVRARRETNEFYEAEQNLQHSQSTLTPTQLMHYRVTRAKRQSLQISNNSLLLEKATHGILKHLRNGRDRETSNDIVADIQELVLALPQIELDEFIRNQILIRNQLDGEKCDEEQLPCDHTSPFRTITGWCNNLEHPEFGKSFSLFNRFLPAAYEDGISMPRQSSVIPNQLLPSPRVVSVTVHDDIHSPHVRYVSLDDCFFHFND